VNWVVDASVVVKWLLDSPATEPDTDAAFGFLNRIVGRETVCQPPHWLIEVIGVTSRKMPGASGKYIGALAAFDWHIADDFDVLKRAADLAEALQHHYFDTLYHAVALETDSVLVTADRRYLLKARHLGHIVHLGDWHIVSG
jgi:predicted nucleic acid-binding protein